MSGIAESAVAKKGCVKTKSILINLRLLRCYHNITAIELPSMCEETVKEGRTSFYFAYFAADILMIAYKLFE